MSRMPVTEITKKVAALEARLNKKPVIKGSKVMTDVEMAPNTYFLRRPSGIMSLDIHTGGGLPAGGLTYVSGPDGAGKTFLLNKYIAMNQRLYGDKSTVALGLSESAPDHFFMRQCGVQIAVPEKMIDERQAERKIWGLPPFTKEELKSFRAKTVGELKILRGAHGEELLQAILACFRTGVFDLICLDSVSAVLPEADALKDLDDGAKRAAAAGMLTRFFQYYLNGTTGIAGQNLTTVIFTSQVRANPEKNKPGPAAMWAREYASAGAWAARHGKLLDILVHPGKKEKEEQKVEGPVASLQELADREKNKRRVQTGKVINYEVLKGKAGVHEGVTGSFNFHFPDSPADVSTTLTDDQYDAVMIALNSGIVREEKGLLTIYDGNNQPIPGAIEVPGVKDMADRMRIDFDLELAVRRAILASVGITCAYR